MSSPNNLPDCSSSTLRLVEATEAEKLDGFKSNAVAWRGQFDDDTYVRREYHLGDQTLTRNGGITYWILVDSAAAPAAGAPRKILSSCESLRKRALIARADGRVGEVVTHGIGSVFCKPAHRRRGYARRMLTELAKKLDTWGQEGDRRTEFTVLFSDIGRSFYAKLGWEVFPSTHIALSPIHDRDRLDGLPAVSALFAKDLASLCTADEALLRSAMAEPNSDGLNIRVALIPDVATIQWHHAREEFLVQETSNDCPEIKGAMATDQQGHRVWCIWTRTFGNRQTDNVLNILRLVMDSEIATSRQSTNAKPNATQHELDQSKVLAVAAILQAAQLEAAKWNMACLHFWNPSPLSVLAAQKLEPSTKIIEHDDESIASLRWHGAPSNGIKIDWVGNEKYAWC